MYDLEIQQLPDLTAADYYDLAAEVLNTFNKDTISNKDFIAASRTYVIKLLSKNEFNLAAALLDYALKQGKGLVLKDFAIFSANDGYKPMSLIANENEFECFSNFAQQLSIYGYNQSEIIASTGECSEF